MVNGLRQSLSARAIFTSRHAGECCRGTRHAPEAQAQDSGAED
jgi:hypothetical protein